MNLENLDVETSPFIILEIMSLDTYLIGLTRESWDSES